MPVTDEQIEAAAKALSQAFLDARDKYLDQGSPEDITIRQLARIALEAAAKVTWYPIKDAPKDGTHIIIWGEGESPTIGVFAEKWFDECAGIFWQNGPTHWQPLPDPPERSST